MFEERNFDMLLAQCALQPKLAKVFDEVLQQGHGNEFYIKKFPSLAGKPYAKARRQIDGCIVCGIYRPNDFRTTRLNPPEDEIIQEHDSLIVLSDTVRDPQPGLEDPPAIPDWINQVKYHLV